MRKGFTLIELLVVVAIIGILASVVLASLNSARAKGQEAAIKSNLKNMIAQAELSYDGTGNYSGACASVANMVTSINGSGGTASCYSHDNRRWGASARLNANSNKNWSVDTNGVASWDTANTGANTGWSAAIAACAAAGGKLPSIEQAKSLYDAYGANPPGYGAGGYWTSTENPANSSEAYSLYFGTGAVVANTKTVNYGVRCVK